VYQAGAKDRVAIEQQLTHLVTVRRIPHLWIRGESLLLAVLDGEPPNQTMLRRQRVVDPSIDAVDGEIARGVVNQVGTIERGPRVLVLTREHAIDDFGRHRVDRHLVV